MAGKASIVPGSSASAAGKPSVPLYLQAECFTEPNAGPFIPERWGKPKQRDPSIRQIKERAAAIRKAYPRDPVGVSSEGWTPPIVPSPPGIDDAVERVA